MPKSTATCNSILALMYNATAWANVADNAASSPLANTYLALHTADLTPAAAMARSILPPRPFIARDDRDLLEIVPIVIEVLNSER